MIIHNDVNKYIALQPRYYRFLKALIINRKIDTDEYTKYDIELILCKSSSNENEYIKIRCINSFDIKVGNIEGMLGLLVDIEDIKHRQLEGARYKIVEQEEGAFSFYCEDFFAEIKQ